MSRVRPSSFALEKSNEDLKIVKCGSSSVGRASAFQAECREFDPRLPLKRAKSLSVTVRIFFIDEFFCIKIPFQNKSERVLYLKKVDLLLFFQQITNFCKQLFLCWTCWCFWCRLFGFFQFINSFNHYE